MVRGPLLVVGDVAVSKDEPSTTNEPNDAGKNATNEAKLAGESYGSQSTDHGQRTTDIPGQTTDNGQRTTDHGQLTTDHGPRTTDHGQRTTDNLEEVESYEQGVARRRAAREEITRKLNEEARKEAEAAMAIRRARIREQKQKKAKPRNQPQGRETRTRSGQQKGNRRAGNEGTGQSRGHDARTAYESPPCTS